MGHESANALSLPLQVTSRYDIARLLRELESLEDFFTQDGIRKQGGTFEQSAQLLAVTKENHVNLADQAERVKLKNDLALAKESSPIVHVSFAVEPDSIVIQKVLLWFRREVSPQVLIHVGVQPSIAAGCVVRTANNYYDFSLRKHLLRNSDILLEKLRSLK